MATYRAKVTSKGQVTVPVEVRRALGLETGDFIALEIKGDYVVAMRQRSSVDIVNELAQKNRHLVARCGSDDQALEGYLAVDAPREDDLAEVPMLLSFPHDFLTRKGIE